MKFKVNDTVLITTGKDKGKQGKITRVLPKKQAVIVEEMNMYTRHIRPYAGQSGDRVRRERPLATAKIAIINDKGQPDRIGYQVGKDGSKERVFRKTGKVITEASQKTAKTKKSAAADKKTTKKAKSK